jgi:hypothetical protein
MIFAPFAVAISVLVYLHLGETALGLLLGVSLASALLWIFMRITRD